MRIDFEDFGRQYRAFAAELRGRVARPGVGTLGPAGTTSEQALLTFDSRLREDGGPGVDARLYDDFGEVYRALLAADVEYALFPNAYEHITDLYWDPRLAVRCSYYRPTPEYGLFRARSLPATPAALRVSSCPAVLSLMEPLAIDGVDRARRREIITVSSTEKAARAVAEDRADVAVTNMTSAQKYGLVAASPRFAVQMLWTIFGRAAAPAAAGRIVEEKRA